MNARIFIEGGGNDSKELHVRCREGFRRLLTRCGFSGRMPRLIACGGRGTTFEDFSKAHSFADTGEYIAMLVDSEEPMVDIEQSWSHLKQRGGWDKPAGADDDQVLMMTTCMETWIVTDREMLQDHFGTCLQDNALPNLHDMESRNRTTVQESLLRATRTCKSGYAKGKRSFEILGKLDPAVLRNHLPSFVRCERVLQEKL